MREASHGKVWYGLALTWEEEVSKGEVWFGLALTLDSLTHLDLCRGRPVRGRSGLVWFGAHLGRGRPARRTYGLLWGLPGKREASHGVGLVWFGAYLGRGRPAMGRSGLV